MEEGHDDETHALARALAAARREEGVGAAVVHGPRGAALVVAFPGGVLPAGLADLPAFEASAPDDPGAWGLAERGRAELRDGVATSAEELLSAAAARLAPHDAAAALRVLVEAGEAATLAGDIGRVVAIGREARGFLGRVAGEPEAARLLAYAEGMGAMMEADTARGAPLLREVIAAGRRATDPEVVQQGGIAATTLGDDSAARALHARAVEHARAAGDDGLLARTLEFLVNADVFHGRYDDAIRHAREGRALARAAGHGTTACGHTAGLALIAAYRGRPEECREHAEEALDYAAGHALGLAAAFASWALAVADLLEGRCGEAADRLAALAAAGPGAGHPLVSLVTAPLLVEAASRAGRDDLAAGATAAFEAFATHGGQPWATALLERSRALLSEGEAADAHFARAVEGHARAGRHFDRARTELLWGETLRRERRRADARPHLRTALDVFARIDAGAWTERAGAELRATGESVRARSGPGGDGELTPREREIAELVATGATNRQIATQLYLSPRTVDHHLRQVFAKLGISSRAELMTSGVVP